MEDYTVWKKKYVGTQTSNGMEVTMETYYFSTEEAAIEFDGMPYERIEQWIHVDPEQVKAIVTKEPLDILSESDYEAVEECIEEYRFEDGTLPLAVRWGPVNDLLRHDNHLKLYERLQNGEEGIKDDGFYY